MWNYVKTLALAHPARQLPPDRWQEQARAGRRRTRTLPAMRLDSMTRAAARPRIKYGACSISLHIRRGHSGTFYCARFAARRRRGSGSRQRDRRISWSCCSCCRLIGDIDREADGGRSVPACADHSRRALAGSCARRQRSSCSTGIGAAPCRRRRLCRDRSHPSFSAALVRRKDPTLLRPGTGQGHRPASRVRGRQFVTLLYIYYFWASLSIGAAADDRRAGTTLFWAITSSYARFLAARLRCRSGCRRMPCVSLIGALALCALCQIGSGCARVFPLPGSALRREACAFAVRLARIRPPSAPARPAEASIRLLFVIPPIWRHRRGAGQGVNGRGPSSAMTGMPI